MTYQVIARRYRPQTFTDVIGQDHVTKTLKNAIESNRLHHAYLFAGARGIGKTTVARLLAKAFNCEKGPTAEPCRTCTPCQEITSGTFLDVQEIDGASNTGVDDVREIRDRAKYMPSGGRYKIYIIDEVHMLSTAAFNALLKILEEPPPHVIFIFATTESHKIPVTILSRCQRYDFRRIPAAKISSALQHIAENEKINVDQETLSLIAHEASGSMRDGQSLLDQAIAYAGNEIKTTDIEAMLGFLDRKITFDLLRAVFNQDANMALSKLEEVFNLGVDLSRFTLDFLEAMRHILVIKECGVQKNLLDVPQDEAKALQEFAQLRSAEEVHQMFQVWYGAVDSVARSAFPKMLLEVLLLRLTRIEPVQPIADIIQELEKLSGGAPTPIASKSAPISQPQKTAPTSSTSTTTEPVNVAGMWQQFIKWLGDSRPQIASIFEHGKLGEISGNTVEYVFDNPFYAGMLKESERIAQIKELMKGFFKTNVNLVVKEIAAPKAEPKKDVTKQALDSEIVKEAANLFDAKVHDVRTK